MQLVEDIQSQVFEESVPSPPKTIRKGPVGRFDA